MRSEAQEKGQWEWSRSDYVWTQLNEAIPVEVGARVLDLNLLDSLPGEKHIRDVVAPSFRQAGKKNTGRRALAVKNERISTMSGCISQMPGFHLRYLFQAIYPATIGRVGSMPKLTLGNVRVQK